MPSKIIDFLIKTRVLDSGQTVDITAMALAAVLGRFAVAETVGWMEVAALFLAFCNYNLKKWFSVLREAKNAGDADKIKSLESQIIGLSNDANFRNLR